MTVLSIIKEEAISEENKVFALLLLNTVGQPGRQYKQIVCESGALSVLSGALKAFEKEEALEAVKLCFCGLGTVCWVGRERGRD